MNGKSIKSFLEFAAVFLAVGTAYGVSVAIGSVTFSGSAVSGDAALTIDNAGSLSLGTASATAITIGQSSIITTIAGTVNFTTASGTSLAAKNVTTTNLTATGITSALVLAGSGGAFSAYGGASACSSGNAVTTLSATGGTTCAAFAQVGTANTWTALQTFNLGATVNGTTTFASTTNALLLAGAGGVVSGYAGSTCSGSNAVKTISATGTVTCTATGSGGSTAWSSLTAPTGSLSLAMATTTTTFTWATSTGNANLLTLTDTATNNGTGTLLAITTAASSSLSPLSVIAGGAQALFVSSSSTVSIGTSTVIGGKLYVVGGTATNTVRLTTDNTGVASILALNNTNGVGNGVAILLQTGGTEYGELNANDTSVNLNASNPNVPIIFNQSPAGGSTVEVARFDAPSFNFGIGNTAPPSRLSVGGVPAQTVTSSLVLLGSNLLQRGGASGTFLSANPTSTNADLINFQVNSSTIFRVGQSNGVSSTLQLGTPTNASTTGCLILGAASGTIGKPVYVTFDSNASMMATTTRPAACMSPL